MTQSTAEAPSPHAARFRLLARRVADAYVRHTAPRTIFLTGSAAEGTADGYSDLDLIMHYDVLPSDDAMRAARTELGSTDDEPSGERSKHGVGERGWIDGVEVEVGHFPLATWEEAMDEVLARHDPRPNTHHALNGLLRGIPLHGESTVRGWQRRAAAYPDGLRVAVVKHHLDFMPLWHKHAKFARRDATVFAYQMLVEGSLNVLGVLAGINRLYFHKGQFKRMRRFVSRMRHAPDRLTDRIEALYDAPRPEAYFLFEALVRDVVDLVDAHVPEVDTTKTRRFLERRQEPAA